jgi:hypothetical protein
MAFSLYIGLAQSNSGSDQQGFGGTEAATQVLGHLSYREPIEVAQRERRPLVTIQLSKSFMDGDSVELRLPRVVQLLRQRTPEHPTALLPSLATPVVNELVAGNTNQPSNADIWRRALLESCHGGEERLSRQVLGQRDAPTTRQQVAVDLWQCTVINSDESVGIRSAHTYYIVWERPIPNIGLLMSRIRASPVRTSRPDHPIA